MSKKGKEAAPVAAEEKKVQTRYDLKMQRRKEEAERAKKEERRSKITTIVIVALLAVFVLSFPIRSLIAVNSTYITVGGEKITRVEFDYNYALAKNSYWNSYGSYMSMFGMDYSTIDEQSYDENLTFADYFEQLAVQQIISTKSMKAAAEAEGFTYDSTEEYNEMVDELKAAAESSGVSVKEYVQASYGSLATLSRLEDIMKETLYTAAFYEQKADEKLPSDADITARYEEDKTAHDSIDYHMTIVNAELPTTNPDGTVPTDEEGNEVAYEPTEEEIAAEMADAKVLAQEAQSTVATDGEGYTNAKKTYINSLVRDFLYDEARQPGDTYVAEDTTNNRYLVVSFDGRYLDETPTVDARIIISTATASQTILDEWKAGEATEESFIELVSKYDENGMAENGGLYEGLSASSLEEEMKAWLTAEERTAGDTFAIDVADDANYVFYYLGENDPYWMIEIRSDLLEENMNAYLAELAEGYEVEDPKGRLAYLQVEEENTAESTETAE